MKGLAVSPLSSQSPWTPGRWQGIGLSKGHDDPQGADDRPVFHSRPWQKEESDPETISGRSQSQKLLLTVREAADMLSLGRTLVYELVMCKQIASIKVGRTRRIPIAALHAFIARRLEQEQAEDPQRKEEEVGML